MKFGVNLTSANHLPLVRRLFLDGLIDYCEVLLDGFWYWSPSDLVETLGPIPTALHTMHTDLLGRADCDVAKTVAKIRRFADALNPLYVSDHLARFTAEGRPFALLQEPFFTDDSEKIIDRLHAYNTLMGSEVIFENFPLTKWNGQFQTEFLKRAQQSGLKILFDVSNVIVGERNGGEVRASWLEIGATCNHFHIGGFRPSQDEPSLTIDSHDCPVHSESIEFFDALVKTSPNRVERTLTVEWDQNISYEGFVKDIHSLRNLGS